MVVEYFREKKCAANAGSQRNRSALIELVFPPTALLYLAAVALVEAAETRTLPDRQRRRRQGFVHASLSWQNQVAAGDVGKDIAPWTSVAPKARMVWL